MKKLFLLLLMFVITLQVDAKQPDMNGVAVTSTEVTGFVNAGVNVADKTENTENT